MRRAALIAALAAALCLVPASAQAQFGLEEFDLAFTESPAEGELPGTLGPFLSTAGAHPDQLVVSMAFNAKPTPEGGKAAEEPVKDIFVDQVPGLVGSPSAVAPCSTADFITRAPELGTPVPDCPPSAALGVAAVKLASKIGAPEEFLYGAVYNLAPPPGSAARLGFWITGVPITIELGVSPTHPYRVTGGPTNISQVLEVIASKFVIWGDPADPAHDPVRGLCLDPATGGSFGLCGTGLERTAFLTLPRACEGPLATDYRADSWTNPGLFVTGASLTHDEAGNPRGIGACGELGFSPQIALAPGSERAGSAAGLQLQIEIDDPGATDPEGRADADIEKLELAFAPGMTLNPSAAEGLGVCSEAQLNSATADDPGCPASSKLGEIEARTPLFRGRAFHGALYLATPRQNPYDSLTALYTVIRDPELGIVLHFPTEVSTDPATGRVLAAAEKLPPFPLEAVRVSLRSGPRAPLITPPACGTHTNVATLYPSSGKAPLVRPLDFELGSGPGGGECPPAAPPFDPGFEAGSTNNAAAAHSPFLMRLTRSDADQDLTRLSATLPPGVSARLAGVERCSEAALAAAAARSGREEQASPSCPESSRIGEVLAGAGVGTALTYVNGALHLAGPYKGAPLSVAAIVPAVAGPFDVGVVATRVGLRLNPVTGRGEVDGAASDPIPHILEGIPLKVREIRVAADRPDFTLNPTSCRESQTEATIFGGGADFLSSADDSALARSARYQAASCASLGFGPRLAIRLFGGVRRGQFPALRAIVRPRPGQANFRRAVVTLPRSAFLEQGHIRTICTRVQFAAGAGHGSQCPKGAVYGTAKAWSPLLDAPASGPVYLRSSNHNLPDLVVALKGPDSAPVQVELSARIDSVRGGIRSTFAAIPDLPVSRFVLAMQGARKGLIVNSRNLCAKPGRNRVRANLVGQNGRRALRKPVVGAVKCAKQKRRRAARRSARGQGK